MAKILSAKPIVDNRIPILKKESISLAKKGLKPSMKVILVGSNMASLLYIEHKKRLCEKINADFELIQLPVSTSPETIAQKINFYNNSPKTTGLFVQLPLPSHLANLDIPNLIHPLKDVDGFHPVNIHRLYSNCPQNSLLPCTPKGILKLFKYYGIKPEGKKVVIIGRSLIVGKPLSLLMSNQNATITLCHSKTKDLIQHTKSSDIIISAVGKAHFINTEFLSREKNQILIDVGINKDSQGKLCGDMNFEEVKDYCQSITPVPGGIGPLTVLSLMENLILATEKQLEAL